MTSPQDADVSPQTPPAVTTRRPGIGEDILRRIVAVCLLLLVIGAGVLRYSLYQGRTVPLPGVKTVVLLLAPGAELADWRNTRDAPTLSGLVFGGNTGIPGHLALMSARRSWLPWRAEIGRDSSLWAPITIGDLLRNCRQLGGEPLATALRQAGVRVAAVGDDPIARTLLGQPTVSGSALLLSYTAAAPWKVKQPQATDGFVTDPGRQALAIDHTVKEMQTGTSSAVVVATFDDLFRCDTYSPLAVPVATAQQRRAALQRLDALVAWWMRGQGHDNSTALMVVSPITAASAMQRGQMLAPVLLWQPGAPAADAAGRSAFLLTSPSTQWRPGLLAPSDIRSTILSLLGTTTDRTGGGAAVLAAGTGTATDAAAELAQYDSGWSDQLHVMRFADGVPWLLILLLLATVFLKEPSWQRAALGMTALTWPAFALFLNAFIPRGDYWVIPFLIAAALGIGALMAVGGGEPVCQRLCVAAPAGLLLLVVIDTLVGGPLLQTHSAFSCAPGLAGRYVGLGDEWAGVLLGAALLTVGLFLTEISAAAVSGLAIAIVLGVSPLGDNVAAAAAAIIGLLALLGMRFTRRLSEKRRLAASTTALVVFLALCLVGDAVMTTATKTHSDALSMAGILGISALPRRISSDFQLLMTNPWTGVLLAEVVALTWTKRRRMLPSPQGDLLIASAAAAGTLLLTHGPAAAAACLFYPALYLLFAPAPPDASVAGEATRNR